MEIYKINNFLRPLIKNGDGYGNGNGNGSGYGDGNGNGYGDGNGYGNGDGNGDGSGNGNGYGNGYGNGNGYGDGNGDGDGDGNGNGNGYGSGNGYGNGDGYGDGNGNGIGIKLLNKQTVYLIDGVLTIISSIKDDAVKGFILNDDLSLSPCYTVRNEYHYSHGTTLKEALKSLEEKTLLNTPIKNRIKSFKDYFKDFNKKEKALSLYEWPFV